MLAHRRDDCLRELRWNAYHKERKASDTVSVFECWKFKGDESAYEGRNWRFLNLFREQRQGGQQWGPNEIKLQKWLGWEDEYAPLTSDPDDQILGGIRLVFCERRNLHTGMSISREAFLMIEREFHLHDTTLPTFFLDHGSHAVFLENPSTARPGANRIYCVAKAYQKVEIMNCVLSVSYDISTGWTTAFICGEGITLDEYSVDFSGLQRVQLIQNILSNHASWDHPLLPGFALLDTVTRRLDARADEMDWELARLETNIGVTVAGVAGQRPVRDRWPEDIDTQELTKDLHSDSTQIIFLLSCCDWMKSYGASLLTAVDRVGGHAAMQGRNMNLASMKEHIQFLAASFTAITGRFTACRDRANLQINVLFTIINQQAAITSRRDANLSLQVAKSSKQDAISMSTFTFITALFLPGSFIATMFSINMFNWQAGTNNNNSSANDTNQAAAPAAGNTTTESYVVEVYWIFWVVTFPLTVLIFIGWRIYSVYANKRWLQELETHKLNGTDPSDSSEGPAAPKHYYSTVLRKSWLATPSSRIS